LEQLWQVPVVFAKIGTLIDHWQGPTTTGSRQSVIVPATTGNLDPKSRPTAQIQVSQEETWKLILAGENSGTNTVVYGQKGNGRNSGVTMVDAVAGTDIRCCFGYES